MCASLKVSGKKEVRSPIKASSLGIYADQDAEGASQKAFVVRSLEDGVERTATYAQLSDIL